MNEVLCSKKDCPHKLACQHGKPHKRLENCEASLCGFGGRVECKPFYDEKCVTRNGESLGEVKYAQ